MRQVTRRYADACVGDRENHAPIVAAELNRHLPTARRVLDGVFDEIERELSNAAAIDRHDDRLGRQVNLDRDSRVLGQQLARFARLLDDLTNVDGLLMEIGAPFVRARECPAIHCPTSPAGTTPPTKAIMSVVSSSCSRSSALPVSAAAKIAPNWPPASGTARTT